MNPQLDQLVESRRDELRAAYKDASLAMNDFPSGPMGLTPDSVKSTPEYQMAKLAIKRAHADLRDFNMAYPPKRKRL